MFTGITHSIVSPSNIIFLFTFGVQGRWWHKFRDVYGLWKQWIFVFVILAAYLALTFGVDVPGCPK